MAVTVKIVRYGGPRSSTRNVQITGGAIWACHKHLSVRCNVHVRIVRQNQLRRAQVPPVTCRRLPNLRLRIHSLGGINLAGDHEHVPIRQGCISRVPTPIVHIW